MKWQSVHFLDDSRWTRTSPRRSRELTPLFIERYLGPRQSNEPSRHDYWELTCVLSGSGILRCGEDLPLGPGTVCLVPPGLAHAERADSNLDTIWIGMKGTHLDGQITGQAGRVQNQVLAGQVERLWLFAIRQSGPIGPELDAFTAGIVAQFVRLQTEGSAGPETADALEQAVLLFHQQFFRKLSIADVAKRLGYSTGHFCRTFKQRTGRAPIDYLTSIRLRHARRLLEYTDLLVAQVASQAGYEDPLYFSRIFRKSGGLTPTDYRRRVRARRE